VSTFRGEFHSDGTLARAQVRVTAANFAEAERFACDLVLANLSWWSYRYDVALDIKGYKLLEEKTEVRRLVFRFLGKSKPLT